MDKFFRTPEEMKENYQASLEEYGEKDPHSSGAEKGVRATAFVTAKMAAEYIPDKTGITRTFYEESVKRLGLEGQIADVGAPYFIELRYKSTEAVIRKMIERFGEVQVVELASGFTAHGLSMTNENGGIKRWIDNDFAASLGVKQESVNNIVGGVPIEFVPGSVLEEKTWNIIKQRLLPGIPVIIFCEGLMMYLTGSDREKLFSNVKDVLAENGGVFVHEDLLKYQKGNAEIEAGRSSGDFAFMTKQIKHIGGNQDNPALNELLTQGEVEEQYRNLGFDVERYRESELANLSLEKYQNETQVQAGDSSYVMHPKQAGEDLLKADFKMWVLSTNKK